MYFRALVLSAFVIAILTGVMLSAYQAVFITPIIIDSEVYEVADTANVQLPVEKAWAPDDGLERHSWNFLSNFLVCFAYALILLSVMSTQKSVTAMSGLLWGCAAYLAIFVSPAIGLPPEIPGMEAAYLEGRQSWWIMTVVLTAISLWMIAFESVNIKVIACFLLLVPHLLGAPQPEIHGFINPNPDVVVALTRLWYDFILQTSIANALLWLSIGLVSGFSVNKFIYSIDDQGIKH